MTRIRESKTSRTEIGDPRLDKYNLRNEKILKPLICDLRSNRICCLRDSRICESVDSDMRFADYNQNRF